MKLGGSGLLGGFTLPTKKTRQADVMAGAGLDLSALLQKLQGSTTGVWDRASLCAMIQGGGAAPAPKMMKRQAMSSTSFVADLCSKVNIIIVF